MHLPTRALSMVALFWFTSIPGCQKDEANKFQAPPPPKVVVTKPAEREVTRAYEFTGHLEAMQTVDLRARVAGFLQKINLQAGGNVKKGDLLFVIEQEPYKIKLEQAKADLASREAVLLSNEAQLKKVTVASRGGAATDLEVLLAQASRDSARADVDNAKAAVHQAELNLSYTEVFSPIDGIVSRNYVDVGNLVGQGEETLLATIKTYKPIYAYFTGSERQLLEYEKRIMERRANGDLSAGKNGGRGEPVEIGTATEEGYPHAGTFESRDNKVDPDTGTILLRAVFDNADGVLFPGLFVRVRVPLEKQKALLVPDDAVTQDARGNFVLVVNDKNVVDVRVVTTGVLDQGQREISHGLSATDRVIVSGLQKARPGSEVQPEEAAPPAAATQTAAAGPGN